MNIVNDYIQQRRDNVPFGARFRIETWATGPSGDDEPLVMFTVADPSCSLDLLTQVLAHEGYVSPEPYVVVELC